MKTKQQDTPAERTSLTRDAIVRTAINLADTHGVEAVTIRRVASGLGVTPMALYWHFRKKDDLLAGMVDWVYGEIDLSLAGAEDWAGQLRALLDAEVAVLRRHPALAPLMLTHESMSPNLLRAIEAALGVLRHAGFSPSEATQIVQHAEQTIVNLVLRQPGNAPEHDPTVIEEQGRQMLASIRSLPQDAFPYIIEAAVPLSRCDDPDEYYRFGMDLLMSGICAMANDHG